MNLSELKPGHLSVRTKTPDPHPVQLPKLLQSLLLLLLLSNALVFHLTQLQVACLRISSIEIPAAVWNGSQATLGCNYQLARGEQLYSVKWYKDYVEFYRFQLEPSGPSVTAMDSLQQHGAPNSKNEFELDGINLDLSKSNGTHVQLRQVSLATEATFKCEVSADSPTFATVSQERQMKVYVLPKQKLIVLDNNNNNHNRGHHSPSMDYGGGGGGSGQASNQKPPVYQPNDLINVTCVSGPSRPGAQLSWLLNEVPLAGSSDQTMGPGRWHISQSSSRVSSTAANSDNNLLLDLIETQSTLTFRVHQDSVLQHGFGKTNGSGTSWPTSRDPASTTILDNQSFGAAAGGVGPSGAFHPIRLRCVAKLSVEYQSETSILVSGGKTLIKKRQQQQQQQQQHPSLLPSPSSLIESQSTRTMTSTHGDHHRHHHHTTGHAQLAPGLQADDGQQHYPIYRWPRPPANTRQRHKTPGGSSGGGHSLDLPPGGGEASWPPASSVAPSIGLDASQATDQTTRSSSSPMLFATRQVALVWANRQLRAQAEFIEQLLRKLRPNELEPPIIEAKLTQQQDDELVEHDASSYADDVAPQANSPDSHNNNDNNNHDDDDDDDGDASASTDSAPNDSGLDGHEVTTRVTLGAGEGDESAPATTTTAVPSLSRRTISWSRSLTAAPSFAGDSHELNDRFEFTCSPQINPAEQTALAHHRSVQLKWLINDKEITSKQINAFDGSRFFYDYNLGQPSATRPPPPPSQSRAQLTRQSAEVVATTTTTTTRPQSTTIEGITLTVELTPSLLQLKEINLKCRTVVEQPLIEYESQFVATIATNPYIQAEGTSRFRDPNNPSQRGSSPYIQRNRSQSGYNNSGGNISNVQRTRHKGTVYKLRTFQASSSSAAEDTHWRLLRSDHKLMPAEMMINLLGAMMLAIYMKLSY